MSQRLFADQGLMLNQSPHDLAKIAEQFFTEEKIPSIIIGPGEPSCMHKANEWCNVKNIKKAVDFYWKLINYWYSIKK